MKKWCMQGLIAVSLWLAASGMASAQSVGKFEAYGGYQLAHLDSSTFIDGAFHGWTAGLQGNLTRSFALVGEVSGVYNNAESVFPGDTVDSESEYFYLFGPRFTKRMSKGNVFVHALIGGAHGTSTATITTTAPPLTCDPTDPRCVPTSAPPVNASATESGFAMAFGGGADVNLGSHFAWRVGQLDYVYSHQGDSGSHFRYSTGIVIRLGKR